MVHTLIFLLVCVVMMEVSVSFICTPVVFIFHFPYCMKYCSCLGFLIFHFLFLFVTLAMNKILWSQVIVSDGCNSVVNLYLIIISHFLYCQ